MKQKLQNASSWTIFIFGVLAFLLGIASIIAPNFILQQLGFEVIDQASRPSFDYTLVYLLAAGMASLNMGAYYILAALNNMKRFYSWTVPFRTLTFIVFTIGTLAGIAPSRFFLVAAWELVGALATGIALFVENKKQTIPVTGLDVQKEMP